MKITYSIWQGTNMKGHSLTASKMSEVIATINDLNTLEIEPKFKAFITRVEQDNQ
jgi:hypothetical protein